MLSFIFKGLKKKGNKAGNILQPPSLINLVFSYNPKSNLQFAKEYSLDHIFNSIPFDTYKSAVAIYISELIYKSVTESETNNELFDFLHHAFLSLDEESGTVADYPLHFTIDLTKFHGFYPLGKFTKTTPYFDSQSGRFCQNMPFHEDFIENELSVVLSAFLEDKHTKASQQLSSNQRFTLLIRLLEYYRLHLPGFIPLKSPAVLREIFR